MFSFFARDRTNFYFNCRNRCGNDKWWTLNRRGLMMTVNILRVKVSIKFQFRNARGSECSLGNQTYTRALSIIFLLINVSWNVINYIIRSGFKNIMIIGTISNQRRIHYTYITRAACILFPTEASLSGALFLRAYYSHT